MCKALFHELYLNAFNPHDQSMEDSIFIHQCTNFVNEEAGEERVSEALKSHS